MSIERKEEQLQKYTVEINENVKKEDKEKTRLKLTSRLNKSQKLN